MLTNISLDHKEMDELRQLFARLPQRGEARRCSTSTIPRRGCSPTRVPAGKVIGYGFDSPGAAFMGKDLQLEPNGVTFALEAEGERHEVRLAVPGRHNASNALAAIAAARALGVRVEDAVAALGRFEGLRRRLEIVGEAGGVTVIDDFAHNPDKIAATLATLRAQPGRLLIMFQPHGYGPLAKMGEPLAESIAEGMAADDRLYLPDPVYQGGTVDRTRGSDWLAEQVRGRGREAEHVPQRAEIADALVERGAGPATGS